MKNIVLIVICFCLGIMMVLGTYEFLKEEKESRQNNISWLHKNCYDTEETVMLGNREVEVWFCHDFLVLKSSDQ